MATTTSSTSGANAGKTRGRSRTAELTTLDCLTLLFLAVAGSRLGLNLSDDTFALAAGLFVHASSFLHDQPWAPLYSAWFRVLALVCPNPIARYFVSWSLTAAALALLPPLFGVRKARLYTLLVLALPLLTVGPFVALFAAAIILLALCLMLRRERSYSGALTASCLACFVVAFCRPEFNAGVFLAAAATLLAVTFERSRHRILKAGIALTLSAAILYVIAHTTDTRSGMAFAQHVSLRAAEHGQLATGEDPWISTYALRAFHLDTYSRAPTGTLTLADFFHADPHLFLRHILANLLDPRTLLWLAMVAAALVWPWLRGRNRPLCATSLFLAPLVLPPILGMLLIYPREHYIVILLPALTLYTLQLVPTFQLRLRWLSAAALAGICLSALLLPRSPRSLRDHDVIDLHRVLCARAVDRLAPTSTRVVFDSAPVHWVYLVHPRIQTGPGDLPQWPDFTTWAARTQPAWIAVDQPLARRYNIPGADLQRFLQADLGYTAHSCPSSEDFTIYTRSQP